jgi:hypothetical protein
MKEFIIISAAKEDASAETNRYLHNLLARHLGKIGLRMRETYASTNEWGKEWGWQCWPMNGHFFSFGEKAQLEDLAKFFEQDCLLYVKGSQAYFLYPHLTEVYQGKWVEAGHDPDAFDQMQTDGFTQIKHIKYVIRRLHE